MAPPFPTPGERESGKVRSYPVTARPWLCFECQGYELKLTESYSGLRYSIGIEAGDITVDPLH